MVYYTELGVKIANVGVLVVIVTIVIWIPFAYPLDYLGDVVSRIFPVGRGLFEDKLANFWCTANIVYKFKNLSGSVMSIVCGLTTLAASAPSLYLLATRKNTPLNFLYALANVSMAFFLFSFHVHEKTILLPVTFYLIITILDYPHLAIFISSVSTFSMYPLLVKDGLAL